METRFECIYGGKKIFQVVKSENSLFTGTWAQCERFKDVHNEKQRKSRHRNRRAAAGAAGR